MALRDPPESRLGPIPMPCFRSGANWSAIATGAALSEWRVTRPERLKPHETAAIFLLVGRGFHDRNPPLPTQAVKGTGILEIEGPKWWRLKPRDVSDSRQRLCQRLASGWCVF